MVSSENLVPWREQGYYFIGRPWFVHEAIIKLEELIEPGWTAFEWGSGSSTLWLGADMLVESAVSVEHDAEWYAKNRAELERYFVANVELIHVPMTVGDYSDNDYSRYILRYPDSRFDLILVDGRNRANCLANAVAALKPGGIMVLDNSERDQYQWAVKRLDGWQRWHYVNQGGGYAGWSTTIWRKPDEDLPAAG